MNVAYPYSFDDQHRTAQASGDDHIRDLIEHVLFTAPGERVNRPSFGSGLGQLVFAPTSGELGTAVQFLVQGALQSQLGDLIQVQGVEVDTDDSTVTVTVQYVVLRTQERLTAEFTRGGV